MRNEEIAVEKGYYVDRDGNVYGARGYKLKGWLDRYGYYCFRVGKKTADVLVHRLQAFQIYGQELYKDGIEVRHLDGDKTNNSPENLALGTKSQNEMDKSPEIRKASAKMAARVIRKLTDEEAVSLRADRKNGSSYAELQIKYGIAKSTVSYIVNKKTYVD